MTLLRNKNKRNSCKAGDTPSDFIRRSRRIWSPAKIASDFRHRLMRTHLAIFFAGRDDVARQPCSRAPSIEERFEKLCDKIAQPDLLALLAIRSDERRKSRERAHLENAGEFNRRYLTCQISAILYPDRGDRRIKSPGVSPALDFSF